MKKLILIALILFIGLATNSWATTTYTGYLYASDLTLTTRASWLTGGTYLKWTATYDETKWLWTYSYTFYTPPGDKNISHVLIEVSKDFSSDNWKGGTTPDDGTNPKDFVKNIPPNQYMPADLHGFKWSLGAYTTYNWTIVTNRAPMWGDFYARDGKDADDWLYAYNLKFGTDTNAPIGNGNAGGWALVPDTEVVIPEPGTFLLLGTGLLGIAAFRFRRSKK